MLVFCWWSSKDGPASFKVRGASMRRSALTRFGLVQTRTSLVCPGPQLRIEAPDRCGHKRQGLAKTTDRQCTPCRSILDSLHVTLLRVTLQTFDFREGTQTVVIFPNESTPPFRPARNTRPGRSGCCEVSLSEGS